MWKYFAIPSDIHIYNVVGMPYTKFWEVLLPDSTVTYLHMLNCQNPYQRNFHRSQIYNWYDNRQYFPTSSFHVFFIIMQKYDDSLPTDKTTDLIPYNDNCLHALVFGQFKRNFHKLDILHYNISFLIMSQLWQPTSKKR